MAMMPRLFGLCLIFTVLLSMVAAKADEDTPDMRRAIFVQLAGQQQVAFIDPDTDRVAGLIDLGMIPTEIGLASSIGKLLSIDGHAAHVSIVDVVSRTISILSLGFVPNRLVVSGDGLTAALVDDSASRVAIIDPLRRAVLDEVRDLSPISGALFSQNGKLLFLATARPGEVDVIDASTARRQAPIATGLQTGSLALTRAPDGRRLYVQPDSGPDLSLLDLVNRAPLPALPRTATAGAAFPSATGRLLLIPDGRLAQLTVVDTTVPTKATVLKAAPNIEAIYFGWFDTVALVPSAARKSVLLYDLDAVGWAGEIALSGRPGRGAVNPEGDRLYLPLPDAQKIAIVDARYRRLTGYIPVSGSPQVIVLAGSYGICH